MKRSENRSVPLVQVAEDIVPLNEFKAHLSEKLRELKQRQRPFIVTQNGRAAAVVLSPEEFDRLVNQRRLLAAVSDGLDDVEAGRVVTDEEQTRRLGARLGPTPRRKR